MGKTRPKISSHELYQLIREDRIEEFNRRWAEGDRIALVGLDFRNQDLRDLVIDEMDFSDCYFRGADLRGLDLRSCSFEGASIHSAHISGTYFPKELPPEEIRLSLKYGTRMRYR